MPRGPRMGRTGVLLDARAAARYRGEVEPIDPVAGHIPGAVNLPFSTELVDADGTFLAPDRTLGQVRRGRRHRAATTAVASCGSGVTACHLILAADAGGDQRGAVPGLVLGLVCGGRPVPAG